MKTQVVHYVFSEGILLIPIKKKLFKKKYCKIIHKHQFLQAHQIYIRIGIVQINFLNFQILLKFKYKLEVMQLLLVGILVTFLEVIYDQLPAHLFTIIVEHLGHLLIPKLKLILFKHKLNNLCLAKHVHILLEVILILFQFSLHSMTPHGNFQIHILILQNLLQLVFKNSYICKEVGGLQLPKIMTHKSKDGQYMVRWEQIIQQVVILWIIIKVYAQDIQIDICQLHLRQQV